jgi:CRISPR-associated protein Cas2
MNLVIGERHQLVVITYDIRDDKTRTKLMKMLKGYGQRVQYSVFEAFMGPSVLKLLKEKIEKLIDLENDSVRYYILCDSCRKKMKKSGVGNITRDEQELFQI